MHLIVTDSKYLFTGLEEAGIHRWYRAMLLLTLVLDVGLCVLCIYLLGFTSSICKMRSKILIAQSFS